MISYEFKYTKLIRAEARRHYFQIEPEFGTTTIGDAKRLAKELYDAMAESLEEMGLVKNIDYSVQTQLVKMGIWIKDESKAAVFKLRWMP